MKREIPAPPCARACGSIGRSMTERFVVVTRRAERGVEPAWAALFAGRRSSSATTRTPPGRVETPPQGRRQHRPHAAETYVLDLFRSEGWLRLDRLDR